MASTAGRELFIQGDDSDLVWVVESGEVEIIRTEEAGGEEHLTVVRSGTYFGELGPLLNMPRSATARALGDTTLTGYSGRLFRSLWPNATLPAPDPLPDPRATHPSAGAARRTDASRRAATASDHVPALHLLCQAAHTTLEPGAVGFTR